MAYPDLYKDESRILSAQNIKVKSVPFDAVLTSRRLILIDSRRPTSPPQEILLATLKNIDTGENAIRDPTISLSLITNTGSTRQMILTFSKTSGGERKRECDEWARELRQHIAQIIEHPVLPDIPELEPEEPVQIPPGTPAPASTPRIEIVNQPPHKKRIEISRPMKRIIESEAAIPRPVETTTLPVGSFCNRCGNRVPPESVFCNKCGTPVVREEDFLAALQHPPAAPEPAPVVPQVAVSVPPVSLTPATPAEKKERPIEEVIHSIEPLIEDSVPRKEPAPLVPRTFPLPQPPVPEPEPVPAPEPAPAPAAPAEPPTAAETGGTRWPVLGGAAVLDPAVPSPAPVPAEEPAPVPAELPAQEPVPEPAPAPAPVAEPAPVPVPGPAPAAASPAAPDSAQPPRTRRRGVLLIGALALVILVVIAGVFLFAGPLKSGDGAIVPAPTPVPATVTPVPVTTVQTPVPAVTAIETTPAPTIPAVTPTAAPAAAGQIPAQGVWIRISSPSQYSGTVGTPGSEREVGGTGEQIYQISTSTGTAVASIKKDDGTGALLVVELYKDGEQLVRKTTTAPKGLIEIQASLKPPTTVTTAIPATIPTTAVPAAGNITANATVNTSAAA